METEDDQIKPDPIDTGEPGGEGPDDQIAGEATEPLLEGQTAPSSDQVPPEGMEYVEKGGTGASMQGEPLEKVLGSQGEETHAVELSDPARGNEGGTPDAPAPHDAEGGDAGSGTAPERDDSAD